MWDAVSGHCLADSVGHAAAVTAISPSKRFQSLCLCSPARLSVGGRENKMLITVSADKIVKVWKIKMQLEGEDITVPKLKVVSGTVAHSKEINCVDIAPNDALVATGSTDKTIKLFELPSWSLVCSILTDRQDTAINLGRYIHQNVVSR